MKKGKVERRFPMAVMSCNSLLVGVVGAKTTCYFQMGLDQFVSEIIQKECLSLERTKCSDLSISVFLDALLCSSFTLASWEVGRFALIIEVTLLEGERGRKLNCSEPLPRLWRH